MPSRYATLDDLLARQAESELVQLSDDEGTGVLSVDRVEAALSSAAIVIDGHVAAKYRTSDIPPPPLLVELACDLAMHKLYARRAAPPDRITQARDAAMKMLVGIAKGTIKLDQGEAVLGARPGAILVARHERLFGRDDMVGF